MNKLFCFFLLLAIAATTMYAQIPRTLSYQGVLTDSAGGNPRNGNIPMTFRLYNASTIVWQETKTLSVKNGLFSTNLGDAIPFSDTVKFDKPYSLGIQIQGEPNELSPRIPLTSVGYSMNALRADTARVAVADGIWSRGSSSNIYRLNGNVGIGTETPTSKLHVGNSTTPDVFRISTGGGFGALVENVNPGYGGGSKLAWIKSLNRNPDSYHLYVEGGGYPELVIKSDGKIGVGTDTPTATLQVGNSTTPDIFRISTGGGFGALVENVNPGYGGRSKLAWIKSLNRNPDSYHLYVEGGGYPELVIKGDGKIGVGTDTPTATLQVGNSTTPDIFRISTGGGFGALVENVNPGYGGRSKLTWVKSENQNPDSYHLYVEGGSTPEFVVRGNGNVGIGTAAPAAKLEVIGRTKTQVLEITGGSDLAEPFEISESEDLPPGSVVIIDDAKAGALKLSDRPYDNRVAGVLSGAGGLNAGVTLGHAGFSGRAQNVALSGRVYTLATTANGTIEPGDLLTTSSVPGHAMKAIDKELRSGAVIGKAMSALGSGEGLVLVLVNLQ